VKFSFYEIKFSGIDHHGSCINHKSLLKPALVFVKESVSKERGKSFDSWFSFSM
jgi:hypothetical protein